MSLRVLISECLLGAPVRYDGGAKPSLAVERLAHCLRRRGGEGAVVLVLSLIHNSEPTRP